jgi:hypothetical protein
MSACRFREWICNRNIAAFASGSSDTTILPSFIASDRFPDDCVDSSVMNESLRPLRHARSFCAASGSRFFRPCERALGAVR